MCNFFTYLIASYKGKEDSDSDVDEPETKPTTYDPHWQETFKWIKPSTLGDNYAYCTICDLNISVLKLGLLDLKHHQQCKNHKMQELKASRTVNEVKDFTCSKLMLRFIQTHCLPTPTMNVSQHTARYVLGLQYPKDISSAAKQVPYCIYLYGKVALGKVGEEENYSCVVLLGFFDEKAAKHRIRILDIFQYVDSDDAIVESLMDIVKRFELPLSNMAAFYVDDQDEMSGKVSLKMKKLNPNTVVLGALYSLADMACSAGVKAFSDKVQQFIVDIYEHCTCCTENDNLKGLFAGVCGLDGSILFLCQNSKIFCILINKVLEMWTDLMSHFTKCSENDSKTRHICSQLEDPKLKVAFMFLDYALGPLKTFNDHMERREGFARADLVQILREASGLLRSYASTFLHPQAVVRFLKERDLNILNNPKLHLPSNEMSFGGDVVENFLSEREAELTDFLEAFQEDCMAFYKALTACIVKGLPLSDGILRVMSQLLSPEGRLKVTSKGVVELGEQFGLLSNPELSAQLRDEFLEYQLSEDGNGEGNSENGHVEDCLPSSSLEHHWRTALKTTTKASLFRTLVLSLLALPCPPLEAEKVFAQVCRNMELTHNIVCALICTYLS